MNSTLTGTMRSFRTLAFGNWFSRAYLVAFTGTVGFFWYDTLFVTHADASLAGAVPLLFTAPTSLLLLLLPDGVLGAAGVVALAAAAVVNAAAIGGIVRAALHLVAPRNQQHA